MTCLYVLFDAECELCVRCRNWLMKQPAFVSLVFMAFQSDEAQRRFPGIDALKPGEQLLVISDDGAVYRGAHDAGGRLLCAVGSASENCQLRAQLDFRQHSLQRDER